MGVFNKYAPPNIEEETARRQALIDEMWAVDEADENEEKQQDGKEEN